ncbi:MAG: hypothetical protein RLZZ312_503 [Bacteroidota bacterium]
MNHLNTIIALNGFVAVNTDRIEAYRIAEKEVKQKDLKILFASVAETSIINRRDLVIHIEMIGGVVNDYIAIAEFFFQNWIDFKLAISKNDTIFLMKLCDVGERATLDFYEKFLYFPVQFLDEISFQLVKKQFGLLESDRTSALEKLQIIHNPKK